MSIYPVKPSYDMTVGKKRMDKTDFTCERNHFSWL